MLSLCGIVVLKVFCMVILTDSHLVICLEVLRELVICFVWLSREAL